MAKIILAAMPIALAASPVLAHGGHHHCPPFKTWTDGHGKRHRCHLPAGTDGHTRAPDVLKHKVVSAGTDGHTRSPFAPTDNLVPLGTDGHTRVSAPGSTTK